MFLFFVLFVFFVGKNSVSGCSTLQNALKFKSAVTALGVFSPESTCPLKDVAEFCCDTIQPTCDCDSNGNLITCDFRSFSLNGYISSDWSLFTQLTLLYFTDNALTGTVPNLYKLSNLNSFWIKGNKLVGGVPYINAPLADCYFVQSHYPGNCLDFAKCPNCVQNGGSCACETESLRCDPTTTTTTTTTKKPTTTTTKTTTKATTTTATTTTATTTTKATTTNAPTLAATTTEATATSTEVPTKLTDLLSSATKQSTSFTESLPSQQQTLTETTEITKNTSSAANIGEGGGTLSNIDSMFGIVTDAQQTSPDTMILLAAIGGGVVLLLLVVLIVVRVRVAKQHEEQQRRVMQQQQQQSQQSFAAGGIGFMSARDDSAVAIDPSAEYALLTMAGSNGNATTNVPSPYNAMPPIRRFESARSLISTPPTPNQPNQYAGAAIAPASSTNYKTPQVPPPTISYGGAGFVQYDQTPPPNNAYGGAAMLRTQSLPKGVLLPTSNNSYEQTTRDM